MSRIDEALARARNLTPADLPPVGEVAAEGALQFPAEPFSADMPPLTDATLESEGPDGADDDDQVRALYQPLQDLRSLPVAEKLMLESADPTFAEQYRRLAARLYLAQAQRGTKVVMVTSALAGEGKTLTATNVALTLSESYKKRVLLIDADLRRPWVHQLFGVPNLTGLNDGLRADVDRKVPLIRFTERLSLLTAGLPDPDPMSVLTSDRMRRVLEDASRAFDWVIIDTPPVALLTDAKLLASLVDTVLLVVRAGVTPLNAIKTASAAVGRERILGVVLNCADEALREHAYRYYGSAYADQTRESAQ
jgi:protein-tyrosine kinase